MRSILLIVSVCLVALPMLWSQDQHFTQFYASPLTLNPALSGNFEGFYRAGINYRNQWRSALERPYSTSAAMVDLRLNTPGKLKRRDKIGVGINFFNDRVGGIDFSTTQMSIAGAYHKSLSFLSNQFLSAGFQMGLTQRNLNYENLSFNDEFNGENGYTVPTNEVLPENNFSYADMAVGINYSAYFDRRAGIYAGAAIHHINGPNMSYYDNPNLYPDNDLYRKFTVHIGGALWLGERTQLQPRVMARKQGPHYETNAGTNVRFSVNETETVSMHLGTWVRTASRSGGSWGMEAIVGLVGLEFNNILLGMSYDANLGTFNGGFRRNAFELSLTYLGEYENESVLCPQF